MYNYKTTTTKKQCKKIYLNNNFNNEDVNKTKPLKKQHYTKYKKNIYQNNKTKRAFKCVLGRTKCCITFNYIIHIYSNF